jgi:hypothetical protein
MRYPFAAPGGLRCYPAALSILPAAAEPNRERGRTTSSKDVMSRLACDSAVKVAGTPTSNGARRHARVAAARPANRRGGTDRGSRYATGALWAAGTLALAGVLSTEEMTSCQS